MATFFLFFAAFSGTSRQLTRAEQDLINKSRKSVR